MELDELETRTLELQESRRRLENKRKTDSEEERDDDGKWKVTKPTDTNEL